MLKSVNQNYICNFNNIPQLKRAVALTDIFYGRSEFQKTLKENSKHASDRPSARAGTEYKKVLPGEFVLPISFASRLPLRGLEQI
jgi:hypothetical protein